MKRLNKKGFTLVELLAVIIILAIVVGITIPAVLTTTNKAKEKAASTATEVAADWFDRQYQVVATGLNGTGIAAADPAFLAVCNDGTQGSQTNKPNNNFCAGSTFYDALSAAAAAGLKTDNVAALSVKINPATGRSCVKMTGQGDYPATEVQKGAGC